MFSKSRVFIVLVLIAAGLGFLAARNDATFRATLWSQMFWLTIGTIATTFLLNAILERDLAARRRKQDQFAFRTFTGTILSSLLDITSARLTVTNQLMSSALTGNKEFAQSAQTTSELISKATEIQPDAYHSHYLDVANHLRDLANRFIRLYSANYEEMVEHYQNLQRLARKWNYRDVFSEGSISYTNSLDPADPVRKSREASLAGEMAEAKALLIETAAYLSDLARDVATKPGMPAL